MRDFAQTAEGLGYDYLVFYEHILGTPPGVANRPLRGEYHESFTTMAYLAGVTDTIGFLTAVVVLPLRQTVIVAKQAAEVDILSGGRLRLGVGLGRVPEEYQAAGANYQDRGKRIEEQIALLRALWTQEWVTFKGKWHDTPTIGLTMLPVQQPIPVWMGGTADPMLERVGRLANGYLTTANAAGVERKVELIRESALAAGRDPNDVGLEGGIKTGDGTPAEWVATYHGWEEFGGSSFYVDPGGTEGREVSISYHLDVAKRFMEEVGRAP